MSESMWEYYILCICVSVANEIKEIKEKINQL